MLKTGTDPGKLGQLVTLDHTHFSFSPHSQLWLHPYFWSKAMGTQGPEVRQCREARELLPASVLAAEGTKSWPGLSPLPPRDPAKREHHKYVLVHG